MDQRYFLFRSSECMRGRRTSLVSLCVLQLGWQLVFFPSENVLITWTCFLPVRVCSIFLLTSIACRLGLDLCHFDAEQAFV